MAKSVEQMRLNNGRDKFIYAHQRVRLHFYGCGDVRRLKAAENDQYAAQISLS